MTDAKPDVRSKKHTFPYEMKTVDEVEDLKQRYTGYLSGAVRVGPEGYYLQGLYRDYAQEYYDFAFRPTDVVVASFPKTGTTWTQELVWLLVRGLDYEAAKESIDTRFPFLEADSVIDKGVYGLPLVASRMAPGDQPPGTWTHLAMAHAQPDPRTIKTHLPFSLLPPDLLETCKVIYVTRDPRDVVTSYHHHHRIILSHGYVGTLEEFMKDFTDEKVLSAPFWSHVREACDLRNKPNLLIVTYEQLKADLPQAINKIAKFLGVTITAAQVQQLAAHLHIDTMKSNPFVNPTKDPLVVPDSKEGGFIRKGISGGWKGKFTDQMTKDMQHWITSKADGLQKEFCGAV